MQMHTYIIYGYTISYCSIVQYKYGIILVCCSIVISSIAPLTASALRSAYCFRAPLRLLETCGRRSWDKDNNV